VEGEELVAASVSPRGQFVYAVGEKGWLYCWKTEDAELLRKVP